LQAQGRIQIPVPQKKEILCQLKKKTKNNELPAKVSLIVLGLREEGIERTWNGEA
jgi:hypothetical protein